MATLKSLDSQSTQKEAKIIALRITMEGRVQRVGLRNWIKQNAKRIGVDGWVRNKNKNESVEALLVGKEFKVKELLRLCYQGGSPFSYIKRIKEFPQSDTQGIKSGFNILPTI